MPGAQAIFFSRLGRCATFCSFSLCFAKSRLRVLTVELMLPDVRCHAHRHRGVPRDSPQEGGRDALTGPGNITQGVPF